VPLLQFWRASSPGMPSETTFFVCHITAELCGRTSKFPLEHAVERRFRCIADLGCDLADVSIGRPKYFTSPLEPPPCQIRQWRRAEKGSKALSESGARNADLVGEVRDGPRARRVLMEEGERFADHGIARSGEPSLLLIRQVLSETPQRLDEQNLREP